MHLIYIGDPLCSWCYGFGTQLSKLLQALPQIHLKIVVGGLRAGATDVLDEAGKQFISLAPYLTMRLQIYLMEAEAQEAINGQCRSRPCQFLARAGCAHRPLRGVLTHSLVH
jgi:hypothetical protein